MRLLLPELIIAEIQRMNIEKGWMENTWDLTNEHSVWLKFSQQFQ